MIKRIREWIGLDRHESRVQDFYDFGNMRTSIYMAVAVILLEMSMMIAATVGSLKGIHEFHADWLFRHIGLYLALFILAVIVCFYSNKCLKHRKNQHWKTMALFLGFSVMNMIFGINIAYREYLKKEQIFTFGALVIFSLLLLVWRPVVTLLLSVLAFSLMYFFMQYADGAKHVTLTDFLLLWGCVLMASIGNYHVRMQHARSSAGLEDMNAKLREIAMTDALTGLKNRYCMREETPELIGKEIIVTMADIDNLKYINDAYSHETGDAVIKRVSDMMQDCFAVLREQTDERWFEVYRFGGDGFILYSFGTPRKELLDLLRKWQAVVHTENFEGTDIHVSISCGVIYGTPESLFELQDMVRFADHTLLEANRIGRLQILTESFASMQEKEREGKLEHRMMMGNELDPLTGIPNIQHFRRHAGEALEEALAAGNHPEFIYFDIYNFKEYNQEYGFQAGDKLLKNVAQKLEALYDGSLLARVSDDHFIVFTLISGKENLEKAQVIRELLAGSQREVQLDLKCGVYQAKDDEADASLACDRAHMACESIKHRFDVKCRIYDDDLEEEAKRKHYIINNLDHAIEQGHIKVFYQPIVSLSDGKLCNLEALARWEDPDYGLLPPGVFIEVLEEYHLIHKLDLCVAEQVCKWLADSRQKGRKAVPVSLNFSRRDFESCDMVEELLKISEKYGIAHHLLDVEITESALTDHPELLEDAMRRFKENGFKIWLDDFGSGYSSLNVLKDFQFDVLKIDMVFLAGFEDNEKTKPIISKVVQLANEINTLALTEGVETDEQREFLKSIGCERAQGYYFGKPMRREDLLGFIEEGKLEVSEDPKGWE